MNETRHLILLWFFSVLLVHNASGQRKQIASKETLTFSYFGEKVFNPGISVAYDRTLVKSAGSLIQIGIHSGAYNDYRNHVGLIAAPQLKLLKLSSKGHEFGASLHFGAMLRGLTGEIIQIDNQNITSHQFRITNGSVLTGLGLFFSKPIHRNSPLKFSTETGFFNEHQKRGPIIHPYLRIGVSRALNFK